ncbi:endonuclease NucS domain-containing protein [Leptospira kmetyi]|nr:endonuclease NucS domain-containing protein [Leptospira kmetyi]
MEKDLKLLLSNNLHWIEEGLTLLDIEHYLPNRSSGANGFVDILAKDKYSNYLLIELKVSSESSRSAIHELFKYISLIVINYKIPKDKIRFAIVSSDWHELLTPFSELSHLNQYQLEGYKVDFNKTEVLSCEKIKVLPENYSYNICPIHYFSLFENASSRNKAREKLEEFYVINTHLNVILFNFDYAGSDNRVIYKNGIYFVLNKISAEEKNKISNTKYIIYEYDQSNEYETPGWSNEYSLIVSICSSNFIKPRELPIADSSKFTEWVHKDWNPSNLLRFGSIWKNDTIYSDEDLITLIKSLEKDNHVFYQEFTSPKLKKKWSNLSLNYEYTLHGNRYLKEGLDAFLHSMSEQENIDVSINIFNPSNIIFSLYILIAHINPSSLPRLEVIIKKEDRVSLFLSQLKWNGIKIKKNFNNIFRGIFKNINEFYMHVTLKTIDSLDESIMNKLNLEYEYLYIDDINKMEKITHFEKKDEKWEFFELKQELENDLYEYLIQNKAPLENICELINNTSIM